MNNTFVLRRLIMMGFLLLTVTAVYGEESNNESWIYGKWELSYDPDGAKTDWVVFLPNGDARSIGPHGKVDGIYIVDGDTVKAVFTWKGKDFIMFFHADGKKDALSIVTSNTGKPSIYKKVSQP